VCGAGVTFYGGCRGDNFGGCLCVFFRIRRSEFGGNNFSRVGMSVGEMSGFGGQGISGSRNFYGEM